MLPIFDEYAKFLKEKINLQLKEGYFWYDKSIIKGDDIHGNIHKFYRLVINDDLSMSYSVPNGYDDINNFNYIDELPNDKTLLLGYNIISHRALVQLKEKEIIDLENESLSLIKEKLEKYKEYTPIVPVSTGKDSMVTLNLLRNIKPDAKAIFNNTTLDVPDTYLMVKTIPNCQIMTPKEGFYQYIERANIVPNRFSRFCCRIFKTGEMAKQLDHNKKTSKI